MEALILDLLEWLAARERTYEEVMEAWRTSCPKLPVWEDASDRGLVTREDRGGRCIVPVRVASGPATRIADVPYVDNRSTGSFGSRTLYLRIF